MDDKEIIQLYLARKESAIEETQDKYGRRCYAIAKNILASREDSEECVNDTWLGAWNAIPPTLPERLGVFVGRIARNLALKRFDRLTAAKRNPEAVCSLDELGECVSGEYCVEDELENRRIEGAINEFLHRQEADKRLVFLRRYWYFDSIGDICRRTGYSRSKVTSMLYQLRQKLKTYLESEEIEL